MRIWIALGGDVAIRIAAGDEVAQEKILRALDRATLGLSARDRAAPLRLWIDRVFSRWVPAPW